MANKKHRKKINYGFVPDLPKDKDYVFGSAQLPEEILNPARDWRPYLPIFEHQRMNIETQACVSFGTNSALEMMHKIRYGQEPNYSDRYVAKMSNTTPTGNTPRQVADTIREISGEVEESLYPFQANSWEEYYAEIPKDIKKKGWLWTKRYEFGFELVKPKDLKKALAYSPVGVAVYAWEQNSKGEYIKRGDENHWCVLVVYDGDNAIIFDSYEENLKKLAKDYEINIAMRYHFKKLPEFENYQKSRNWFKSLIQGFVCEPNKISNYTQ